MAGSGQTIPTTGPFSVMIGGFRPASHGEPATYAVHVTGKDGAHWVRRRYTDFEALRSSMGSQAVSLPTMPPKSFFRQRISANFQRSRIDGLVKVAASVMGLDSMAASPGVRRFLGLDAPIGPSAAEEDPEVEYWEQRLSRRIEAAKQPSFVSTSPSLGSRCLYAVEEEGSFEDEAWDAGDRREQERDVTRADCARRGVSSSCRSVSSSWSTEATPPMERTLELPEENDDSAVWTPVKPAHVGWN